jgi:hypothetical protein
MPLQTLLLYALGHLKIRLFLSENFAGEAPHALPRFSAPQYLTNYALRQKFLLSAFKRRSVLAPSSADEERMPGIVR